MKDYLNEQGLTSFVRQKPWLLLYFSTNWCAPCRPMAEVIATIEIEHGDILHVVKIDVDKQFHIAKKLGVKGVPTVFLLNEGKVIDQLNGGTSFLHVNQWLLDNGIAPITTKQRSKL